MLQNATGRTIEPQLSSMGNLTSAGLLAGIQPKRRHRMMRKLLFASAALVIATPAAARDGSPYVGLEGGILFPQHMTGIFTSTFTQAAQSPAAGTPLRPGTGVVGTLPAAFTTLPARDGGSDVRLKPATTSMPSWLRLRHVSARRRAWLQAFERQVVQPGHGFGTAVTTGLIPAGATQTTAFVFPNGNLTAFNLGNDLNIWSGMINGLVDFGNANGVSFYAGGGIGRARFKPFQHSDSAWAYQGIAVFASPSVQYRSGLKYRYFRTGNLDFVPGAATFSTVNTVAVPNVHQARPRDQAQRTYLHPHGDRRRRVQRPFLVAQPAAEPSVQLRRGAGHRLRRPAATAAAPSGDADLPGRQRDRRDGDLPGAASAAAASAAAGRARRARLSAGIKAGKKPPGEIFGRLFLWARLGR